MVQISTKLHGVLDYAGGLGSLAAPKLLADPRVAALLGVSGAGTLTASALTDYELGLRRRIPMRVHLLIDAATGSLLLGGAVVLRRRGVGLLDCAALVMVGLAEVAGAALTSDRPSDRAATSMQTPASAFSPAAAASGAAGPPLASAPLETPGPSVTPSQALQSDVERAERADAAVVPAAENPDDDVLVAREESAAAAEAGRIGGPAPADAADPAMEPVYQAGGGEQEGWEAAEEDLVENASHSGGAGNPLRDALTPELESDRSGAAYGEADEEAGPDDR
ncbi:MAG TPA: hypothetical protein VFP55_04335 [Solirubrobacteraceae bacterium]|nr:hypothetical protein [Solirubrobacteraceae bacterium]